MSFSKSYKAQLLKSIPIVSDMNLDLQVLNSEVHVKAPLSTHINYEGSAFGGSVNTVCVLACYLMTKLICEELNIKEYNLVIHDSQIKYLKPIQSNFKAISKKPQQIAISKFKSALKGKKIARLKNVARVFDSKGELCAEFAGRYVVKLK